MNQIIANAWLEDYQRRVPERTLAMTRLYVEEGQSYAEIGERYGLTRQRVGQLLGPLGLQQYRRQSALERIQALRDVHARIMEGEATLAEEAPRLGYKSARSLRSALYELGLRVVLTPEIPAHGTIARYRSRTYCCRCDECRRANRDRGKELKGKEPPRHGTHSAYVNYECRCVPCKEANRKHVRERKAAKRRLASQD